jgi:dTDP-4-amino-4,6-dideoxygalactose transaminase
MKHPGLSASHIMPIILPAGINRYDFMEHMKSQGIQTSIHYPPIHKFSAYQCEDVSNGSNLEITEKVSERELTLPLYPSLKFNEVEFIVNQINRNLSVDI